MEHQGTLISHSDCLKHNDQYEYIVKHIFIYTLSGCIKIVYKCKSQRPKAVTVAFTT